MKSATKGMVRKAVEDLIGIMIGSTAAELNCQGYGSVAWEGEDKSIFDMRYRECWNMACTFHTVGWNTGDQMDYCTDRGMEEPRRMD